MKPTAFLCCFFGFSLPSFATVTETTLDNGLKIIVKEDHRAPVMVSQIWYKVGSSYEHNGATGVSHILEHMMFKGTDNLKPNEFSKIISANGGRENAFTGRDYTAYFQRMERSRYPISFKLEADRMRNLKLHKGEFLKERAVVGEERRMRTDDNPSALLFEQFMATAYTSSPYHHPIIGWASDIKNTQLQDLTEWYQKWYAPNNATLVVAGDVTPEAVIAEAKKHFGPLQPSKITPPKPQKEPLLQGEKHITHYSEKVTVPSITIGFHVPTLTSSSISWEPYALEVMAYILDGGKSSRIAKELIREKKIASSAGVGYSPTDRLSGLFILQGTPSTTHDIATVKQALLDQIKTLQTELVNDEELQRIITQLVASQTYERDSVFYQAMQIGQFETIGLDWKTAEGFVDKLKQVTKEQIQQVAKKYFSPRKLVSATLLPATAKETNHVP